MLPIITSCTVTGDNISFTRGGIALNKFYTANITLRNGRINATSEITVCYCCYSMLMLCVKFAGTYDVQDIAVNSSIPNAVSFLVNYALNSNASGVLFVTLFIVGEEVNFDLSVHVAIDHDISMPLLTNITRGTYRALSYDIEMDGLLQLGNITPTDYQMVYVNGTGKILTFNFTN